MIYRAKNYSCRGQKCAQKPAISIAASEELKEDVIQRAHGLNMSVSAYVRAVIETDLTTRSPIKKIEKDS